MSVDFFGASLEWARPAGLWALALPLVVILASLVGRRPRQVFTGTLVLWRSVGDDVKHGGTRRERRFPPARWLLVLALTAGALALAGPRGRLTPAGETWRVLVDRSPSMYLPADGAGRVAGGHDGEDAAGPTRLEKALADLFALRGDAQVAFIWEELGVSWPGERLDADETADDLPRTWAWVPAAARPEPDWAGRDEPGALWLTDRVPDVPRHHAGLVASGGVTSPGWVAWERQKRFRWNAGLPGGGEGALEEETSPDRPPVVLFQGHVVSPLRRFIEIWAEERGLRTSGESEAGPLLRVVGPYWTDEVPVTVGADGWTLSGTATRGGAPPFPLGLQPPGAPSVLETRLAVTLDGDPWALVTAAPGHLELAWRSLEEPRGDPAAFAVWWGSLLDELLLDPPGVVSLRERQAAGEALAERPRPAGSHPGTDPLPASEAPLTAAALILALAWVVFGTRG